MHLGKPAEVLAFSAIHRYAYLQTIPEQAVDPLGPEPEIVWSELVHQILD